MNTIQNNDLIGEYMKVDRMPSLEMIGKRLYNKNGTGLYDYSYSICGSSKLHTGRMHIEIINQTVICQDIGSQIRFKIGMVA